jgi:riboflavin biosynthesis pyrimidine reductase
MPTPQLGSRVNEQRITDEELADLYAWPPTSGPWVRANFATSLDGAITGPDGRSATVNSEADHVVFELLRALSDVVVVGAGTLRSEGYTPIGVVMRWRATRSALGLANGLPLVCVSNRGDVPPKLLGGAPGAVLLATHTAAAGLAQAREQLGPDSVLICGDTAVDDPQLIDQLVARGWTRILTEGGPHLLSSMVAAGVLDEICLSVTPVVVGGRGRRITTEAAVPTGYAPRVLVEQDGTLLGRWFREASDAEVGSAAVHQELG